ncbi:uncharacterized protein C2845_PM17G05100 [Panicum miliaceum]|uniref:Transposase-associated domain-containing protein n=1 Tax=Panicum miliaceum TaxID=4540 RepID=A0A3L6PZB2_PANMI|nr:uncharacterized protein C2845_PM17G05100 [Panicum miliaceum]
MDRGWINSRLFSKAHQDGVSEFMKFVSERFGDDEEILCPCRQCLNHCYGHRGLVQDHLYMHGMCSTYDKWIHHGEQSDGEINDNAGNLNEPIGFNEDVGMDVEEEGPNDDDDDRIRDMVKELYTAEQQDGGDGRESMFAKILEEMKNELYPGAAYSRFSFVVKLLHIKSFYRISNVGFTAILKLLSSAFPHCSLPASYNEAKNLVRAMGLGYVSIHACSKNCVLFRKDHANKDECPICGESRWKDKDGKKKIPQKVLRHFPLIPRLKRMFASKKIAEEVKWHKLKRKPVENELSHPADGEAWQDFDRKYDWFAQATKVFYLKDTKHADDTKITESWRIVQKFSHRHLWNVPENNNDDERPNSSILSYQDDSCEGFQVQGSLHDEENLDKEQPDDEDCLHVDVTVVDKLRGQRQEEIEDNDESDDEDETRWQYASDNESPTTPHNDDDEEEDSDGD